MKKVLLALLHGFRALVGQQPRCYEKSLLMVIEEVSAIFQMTIQCGRRRPDDESSDTVVQNACVSRVVPLFCSNPRRKMYLHVLDGFCRLIMR